MNRKKDVVLWGALACALVGTAHAEYTLATATGVNQWVALAVPGALDLYVIRALQARKDVLVAVLVMVAANVASHLVRAGEVPVDWRLHSAVGALTPLLLWRIYSLMARVPEEVPAVPAPDPVGTSEVPVPYLSGAGPYTISMDVPADAWPDLRGYQGESPCERLVPDLAGLMEPCECGYLWGLHRLEPPPQEVPDEVPAEWSAGYDTGVVSTPDTCGCVRGMHAHVFRVCDECGCTASAAKHPEYLKDGDDGFLEALALYLDDCRDDNRRPSIKDAKAFIGVGQDRARRLLRYAGYPAEKEES